MCLMVCSREGKILRSDQIEYAFSNNPHGFGIAFPGKKLEVYKTMNKEEIPSLLGKVNNRPYVAHFRAGTHGTIGLEMCHPFSMSEDLVVFHNGVIELSDIPEGCSDTWTFTHRILKPYFLSNFKKRLTLIEQVIGSGNKLAFIDNTGSITIANESGGNWANGIWYSNVYSLYPLSYIQQLFACEGGIDLILALAMPE